MKGRTLALIVVLVTLAGLFAYVVLRSGPLAPVPVTTVRVESLALTPALFGIGTVEARNVHGIGPTATGRVLRVVVQPGDTVRAGQLLGEMDPVDLDDRIAGQDAALKRAEAEALAAEAQLGEARARMVHASAQEQRYGQLVQSGAVSEAELDTWRQELGIAEARVLAALAGLEAAHREQERSRAEHEALLRQLAHLRLVAPVEGLIVAVNAEGGDTAAAGQAVVEMVDPSGLWVNVRFDQLHASGLHRGGAARIVLRSQQDHEFAGAVMRVESLADSVTEEVLAKVGFDILPEPLPYIGEFAEVIVTLSALPATPVVPNACIRRVEGVQGVWGVEHGTLRYLPVVLGRTDLDGRVQVLEGLQVGDEVVAYSQRELAAGSRITIVETLPGVEP